VKENEEILNALSILDAENSWLNCCGKPVMGGIL